MNKKQLINDLKLAKEITDLYNRSVQELFDSLIQEILDAEMREENEKKLP